MNKNMSMLTILLISNAIFQIEAIKEVEMAKMDRSV